MSGKVMKLFDVNVNRCTENRACKIVIRTWHASPTSREFQSQMFILSIYIENMTAGS